MNLNRLYKSLLKKEILAKYQRTQFLDVQMERLKEIEEIEQKQATEYTMEREAQVNQLINRFNNAECDDKYKQDIMTLQKNIVASMKRLYTINQDIPDTFIVTNYSVKSDKCG
jgi:hypothetical protein